MPSDQISPGVYTRIIDLSAYLADVPGTIGFVPILSRRGPDNQLVFISSRDTFRTKFGEPNYLDYVASGGQNFSQGPYVAWNHLSASSHLYTIRALPDDATFSHLFLGLQVVTDVVTYQGSSSSGSVSLQRLEAVPLAFDGEYHLTPLGVQNDYVIGTDDENAESNGWIYRYPTMNSVLELDTVFETFGANNSDTSAQTTSSVMYPSRTGGTGISDGMLCYFRGLGRGDSYDDFAVRLRRHANEELFGVYVLDIYETQSDGDDVIIESFNVSFDRNLVDDTGESMFIEDVLNRYSANVRCKVNSRAIAAMDSYKQAFYQNDPSLPEGLDTFTVLDENGMMTDLGYKATVIELRQGEVDVARAALDADLDSLNTARGLETATQEDIVTRNEAIAEAIEDISLSRQALTLSQQALNNAFALDLLELGDAEPTSSTIEPYHFEGGTEGSLVYVDGTTGHRIVQSDVAKQVLSDAYLGELKRADVGVSLGQTYVERVTDEIYDLDWIYFSLVYDAGYDSDVKQAAKELVDELRRDCVLIADTTDTPDFTSLEKYVGASRETYEGIPYPWNSRYAARYSPFTKIYDSHIGRDVWMTPVFHMAQIIPASDAANEIWYAPAGFNRATISDIKELRWNPKKGERDRMYLFQVNPIVNFPQGYTVWGNLTTQKRPSALQDLNIMRLVLYIKRALEQFAKFFIFEFNDSQTWDQIKSQIIPFLDRIVQRRGLIDFSVDVGATPYEFKNKICHINVTLNPTRVIEKIELNLYIV